MELLQSFIANFPKYFMEGAAVMVAAKFIPNRSMAWKELIWLACVAAVTFWILDQWAPEIGVGARFGAGFKTGTGMVEGMCGGGCGDKDY